MSGEPEGEQPNEGGPVKHPAGNDGGKNLRTRMLETLLPFLAACGAIAAGAYLGTGKSTLHAILLVTITVSVSAAIALLISESFLRRTERVISARIEEATITKTILPKDTVGALWTQEQLSELERAAEVKTIWIVGQNFRSEINEDAPFLEVVRHNIHRRGICYVYIAPNMSGPQDELELLRRRVRIDEDDDLLRILLLDTESWAKMPYTAGNFTIYGPYSNDNQAGYFWYPGGDGKSFGQLGQSVVGTWVSRIEKVCPKVKIGSGDTASDGGGTTTLDGAEAPDQTETGDDQQERVFPATDSQ
jgi:hypothetical protein